MHKQRFVKEITARCFAGWMLLPRAEEWSLLCALWCNVGHSCAHDVVQHGLGSTEGNQQGFLICSCDKAQCFDVEYYDNLLPLGLSLLGVEQRQ